MKLEWGLLLCGCIVEGSYVVYIEYQSVCPFVGIESPNSIPRKRVWLPPGPKGGGGTSSLAGEGVGGLNSDDWTESLALCLLCGLYKCTCVTPRIVHNKDDIPLFVSLWLFP